VIDFHTFQARGHRQNIERYCRLLATDLTELERQYLHKRIAEEYAQLERLQGVKQNHMQESRPRPQIKVQESA
jgi:hypothetical protein